MNFSLENVDDYQSSELGLPLQPRMVRSGNTSHTYVPWGNQLLVLATARNSFAGKNCPIVDMRPFYRDDNIKLYSDQTLLI